MQVGWGGERKQTWEEIKQADAEKAWWTYAQKWFKVSIPTSTDRRLWTRGFQLLGYMPRLWDPNSSFLFRSSPSESIQSAQWENSLALGELLILWMGLSWLPSLTNPWYQFTSVPLQSSNPGRLWLKTLYSLHWQSAKAKGKSTFSRRFLKDTGSHSILLKMSRI